MSSSSTGKANAAAVKWVKFGILAAVTALIWFLPCPAGMEPVAWQYFAIYLAAILGIVLRPLPEPVMMLGVLGLFSLITGPGIVLSGYSDGTAWLVFSAFLISVAFAETGLGRRIAYLMIGRFGKSTLGIGYSLALTDLVISPATPSNTARTGGIVFPIFNNVADALGSSQDRGTSRKLASYLTLLAYHVSLSTAAIFLTAMAPNAVTAGFAKDILSVDLNWGVWAKAAFLPGMIVLFLIPVLIYKVYPPEIKKIDNYKEISSGGLRELGPMAAEKLLLLYFVTAIVLWATGSVTGLNATSVALAFLAVSLLTGVISWKKVLEQGGAWNTLIWYGGILGISGKLAGAGFFTWLSERIQSVVDFSNINKMVLLFVLVVISVAVRYVFASTAAYGASMIPVLYTIGLVAQIPVFPLALMIAFSSAYGSLTTHYGGALGPVLYATGNVDQKPWWGIGLVTIALNIVVYFAIGLPYWKLIGLW